MPVETDDDLETFQTTDKFVVKVLPSRRISRGPPVAQVVPAVASAHQASQAVLTAASQADSGSSRSALSLMLRNSEALGKDRALSKASEDALLLAEAARFRAKGKPEAKGKTAAKGKAKGKTAASGKAAASEPADPGETGAAMATSSKTGAATATSSKTGAAMAKPVGKKTSKGAKRAPIRSKKSGARKHPSADAALTDGDVAGLANLEDLSDAAHGGYKTPEAGGTTTPEAGTAFVRTLSGASPPRDDE